MGIVLKDSCLRGNDGTGWNREKNENRPCDTQIGMSGFGIVVIGYSLGRAPQKYSTISWKKT